VAYASHVRILAADTFRPGSDTAYRASLADGTEAACSGRGRVEVRGRSSDEPTWEPDEVLADSSAAFVGDAYGVERQLEGPDGGHSLTVSAERYRAASSSLVALHQLATCENQRVMPANKRGTRHDHPIGARSPKGSFEPIVPCNRWNITSETILKRERR
jgi:hypothetical protein